MSNFALNFLCVVDMFSKTCETVNNGGEACQSVVGVDEIA